MKLLVSSVATCYLYRRKAEATFNFTLAIRMYNGQFKETDENVFDGSNYFKGYSKFLSLEELKGSDGYLDNDTLTVRCRMWKTDFDISASVKWGAHSRIKVSKFDYTWIFYI
ncbi:hypothetical protein JTE90_008739 [Oedothorax gibbosus]|uniref:MATH domain-containing protein n=1 Tax=Oedothorax gibbosus TaxID=931172 RepID=A0AAV6USC4_9ARAC|nr:hypothetical protein JTE90_008739 [Oedothorax gibbosus]